MSVAFCLYKRVAEAEPRKRGGKVIPVPLGIHGCGRNGDLQFWKFREKTAGLWRMKSYFSLVSDPYIWSNGGFYVAERGAHT